MAFLFFYSQLYLSTFFVPIIIKIGTKFRLFDQPDTKRKKNYKKSKNWWNSSFFINITFNIHLFFSESINIYPFEFELNYYLISSLIFYFF